MRRHETFKNCFCLQHLIWLTGLFCTVKYYITDRTLQGEGSGHNKVKCILILKLFKEIQGQVQDEESSQGD